MPKADLQRGVKVCSREDCPHGKAEQPITNFNPSNKYPDGYRTACRDCNHREKELITQEQKNVAKEKSTAVRELAQAAYFSAQVEAGASRSLLEQIAYGLVRHAGGVDQLVTGFWNVLLDPMIKPAQKIRIYQTVFSVVKDNDMRRPDADDPQGLSDEDLNERIEAQLRKLQNKDAIEVEFHVDEHSDHPTAG